MSEAITAERIDELLRFQPVLAQPDRQFVAAWEGGQRTKDGAITLPYPQYQPDVLEFSRVASQDWWLDRGYRPADAAAMLADDEAIDGATGAAT